MLLETALRQAASPAALESGDLSRSPRDSILRLLDSLDEAGRGLVEAAAVLAEPASLAVLSDVAALPAGAEDSAEAISAGLLAPGPGGFTIPHDLLARAVYESLAPSRRRALHRQAIRWTAERRRLEHRAAAASAPDPELAAELTAWAATARADRRHLQAAAAEELARTLTPDHDERDRLLLHAVLDRVAGQDLEGAQSLADAG